jgi:hypothetical protein
MYFGELFEKNISGTNCRATSFLGKSYVLISTQNGLSYILSDFFQKAVWPPVSNIQMGQKISFCASVEILKNSAKKYWRK